GAEDVAVRLELTPQFVEVVDLAVVADLDVAVFVAHRLASRGREIEHAQAPVRQTDWPVGPDAVGIRAAVAQRVAHGPHTPRVHGSTVPVEHPSYATHESEMASGPSW